MKALLALPLTLWLAAGPAGAASDPDWPCQTPRRPDLSIGQMWTGPLPDAASAEAARSPEAQALAARLASRKLPLEPLLPELDGFAQGADAAAMTGLFAQVFDMLESRRRLVIARIDDFAGAQRGMRDGIDALRSRMAELDAADPPDYDAIDQAEAQLDLAQTMFKDRQDQIRYVCDVPNLIEQRLFAVARAIAERTK